MMLTGADAAKCVDRVVSNVDCSVLCIFRRISMFMPSRIAFEPIGLPLLTAAVD
jgi:hypothetical protein